MSGFGKHVKQGIGIAVGFIIVGVAIGIGLSVSNVIKQESFNSELETIKKEQILKELDEKYGNSIVEPTIISDGGEYEIWYDAGVHEAFVKDSDGNTIKSINKGDRFELKLEDNWRIDLQLGTSIKIRRITD